MKLLISTPLQIFLFDTETSQLDIVRTGDGYYYGISYRDGKTVLSSTGGYLQFLKSDNKNFQTGNHLIQPHQVEWITDNRILAANTGKNCISVFDRFGKLEQHIYFNDIRIDDKDSNHKGNHFNSVHRENGRVYVVAHNYDRPSEIYELSLPELKIENVRETKAGWAHNIWPCELGLVLCDSKNGNLIDVETGEILWTSGEKAMTRGLAASEDYIFVGYSMHNVRKDRFWNTGGVWIIDRRTLKTIDKCLFPGSGDVHEVRLVGIPDHCHNDQVLELEQMSGIRKKSPLTTLAYHLRRTHPKFQKELFPIAPLIQGEQMISRWVYSLSRANSGHS